MKETVCQFGPNEGLTGILTEPDDAVRVVDAPIALILNAGIVHNIGPFRLHVDIARLLAEAGFSSLRIDISGLGDSETRTGKLLEQDRAVQDVSDAADFLKTHTGSDRFVAMGLCSGAFNAHQAVIADTRFVGAVFLDGIVFRTFGFYLRHYGLRFAKPRFWRNAIKRRVIDGFSVNEGAGESLGESEFFEVEKTCDEISAEITGLVNRDVQMLFVYTEGYDDVASASQFQEMFGIQPGGTDRQVQVEYFSKAEHTFRLTQNRKAACARIGQWYRDRFAGVAIGK